MIEMGNNKSIENDIITDDTETTVSESKGNLIIKDESILMIK